MVEVNSHSLFSKWFSESGKLVQKMFSHVQELIDDPVAFVCVLIDEVESLAAARKASSSEPSDAIRVVNAVLTQVISVFFYEPRAARSRDGLNCSVRPLALLNFKTFSFFGTISFFLFSQTFSFIKF